MDIAIEYNAKLIELEDNIKQLESLEMDASHFKNIVERIKKETEQEVQNSYTTFPVANSFRNDALIGIYEKAKKQLDLLNYNIISEYESYYKIYAKCKELNEKCEHLNEIDISVVVEDTLTLLKGMKQTTTIDYNDEKSIVESVYKLVYRVIKLELVYTNQSLLLEQLRISVADISYLTGLIKEDIQKLDNSQVAELSSKLQEIDRKGFDDIYYLDRELILLISISQNKSFLKKVEDTFSRKIDQCRATFDELNDKKFSYQDTQTTIDTLKKEIKKISGKRFRKKILLYVNVGLVGTALLGSVKLCKDLSKEKQYKTITVTYDTDSLEEKEMIEYVPSIKDSVEIIEYSPWEAPGYFRNEFKRNVYTYDLSNVELEFDQPKDYLTPDIKDSISMTATVETSSEIPEDMYVENRYVATMTTTAKMTYDTDFLENNTTIEYIPSTEDPVELIEYSPWEAPGYFRDEYKRNIYTYNLDNVDVSFENPKDYLTDDIKDSIQYTETLESSFEISGNQYISNKYVVTKTTQDKTDFYEKDNIAKWAASSIMFAMLISGIDALLVTKLSKAKLKGLKEEKKKNKMLLEQKKQLLLETHTQMDELTGTLADLKNGLEKDYQELPQIIQQDDNIKQKMKVFDMN